MFATHVAKRMSDAVHRHRTPVRWPWVLVAAAWGVALLATLTNRRELIDHHYLLVESRWPWLASAAVFALCWQVMTLAMMLPSSMPVVYMMAHASRKQSHPRTVQAAFLAGYALVWTGFGLAAFLGDTLVHRLVDGWPWLATHPWLIGATTLAVAGSYQLSPLKARSLDTASCRTPFGAFLRSYPRGVAGGWRLGLRHGVSSLGCCWALMLVMFGLGVGSLVWMAALAGVTVVEMAVPGGQRLSPVIGAALLLLAVLWLALPTWAVGTVAGV